MRILLIDPRYTSGHHYHPCLGLGYVAAVLEGWNELIVLDLNFPDDNKRLAYLLSSEIDLVGVTATSFTLRHSAAILKEAKSRNNKLKTVMGGPHTSIAMAEVFQHTPVDYVIYGEGERTIIELVRVLENNRDPSLEELTGIRGLMFRHNGEVIVNPPRPWITNLNELPLPAFHLWELARYPVYPLLTSRGCPFGCIYCAIGVIWGREWRARSPANIIEEIKYTLSAYNWKHKHFAIMDDSFNVSIARVLEFCEQLISEHIDIEWNCQGIRANNITLELAEKMKMAGCHSVTVGVESADPKVLKNINKGETIEDIAAGIENLTKAQIAVSGTFMIGNPGDNMETCKRSMEFIQRSSLIEGNFYLALPYPKTGLWEYVHKQGRLLEPDYTEFQHISERPVFETSDFPAEERIKAYQASRKFTIRRKMMKLPRGGLTYLRSVGLRKIGIRKLAILGARFIIQEFKQAAALLRGKGHPWEQ